MSLLLFKDRRFSLLRITDLNQCQLMIQIKGTKLYSHQRAIGLSLVLLSCIIPLMSSDI